MTTTRWLDEREAAAWRGWVTTNALLETRLNRQLQTDSDLSLADFGVLVQLSESAEGRLRAFELGRALDWEKSRLSHHLTRMEARGLVERRQCPSDRRGAFVHLTPHGRAVIEAAAPGHVEAVRALFLDLLTADEIEVLATLTARVLGRLAEPAPGCDAPGAPAAPCG